MAGDLPKQDILLVIAQDASIDPALIDDETTVAELGISSLDLIELIFKIESRFGIEVPAEGPLQSTDVKVSALVDYVAQLVAKQGATAGGAKA